MVYSFLAYLQLSVGFYLNLWKDLSKKEYNTVMSMLDKKNKQIDIKILARHTCGCVFSHRCLFSH